MSTPTDLERFHAMADLTAAHRIVLRAAVCTTDPDRASRLASIAAMLATELAELREDRNACSPGSAPQVD